MYVTDIGINIHYIKFEGRMSWGEIIPENAINEDGNGHGTHCVGTIGLCKYGVAEAANLIVVKIFGSNGSLSAPLQA